MFYRGLVPVATLLLLAVVPRVVVGQATIALSVVTANVVHTSAYAGVGANIDVCWDYVLYSTGSANALRNAGTKTIRFPGGAPALWYDWSNLVSMQGVSYCEVATPLTQVSNFLQYCNVIGADPLIQTNTAWNSSYLGEFLDELVANGTTVKFWEIGNEQDLSSSGSIAGNNVFTQAYFDAFKLQASVIHAKMPGALVIGPASYNTYAWWTTNDMAPFLNQTGNRYGTGAIDALSVHYYPGPYQNCDTATNMQTEAWNGFDGAGEFLRNLIAQYDTRNLPIFVTETNAGDLGNCDTSSVVMNALSQSDDIGVLRLNTVDSIQFFGNPHKAESNYGMLFEDDSASATFYMFLMWNQMGGTVLNVTGFTGNISALTAYASLAADGSLLVIVNNKQDAAQTITLTADISLNSTVTTWQVASIAPATGCWQLNYTYNGVSYDAISNTHTSEPPPTSSPNSAATFAASLPACSVTLYKFAAVAPATTAASSTTEPSGSGSTSSGGSSHSSGLPTYAIVLIVVLSVLALVAAVIVGAILYYRSRQARYNVNL